MHGSDSTAKQILSWFDIICSYICTISLFRFLLTILAKRATSPNWMKSGNPWLVRAISSILLVESTVSGLDFLSIKQREDSFTDEPHVVFRINFVNGNMTTQICFASLSIQSTAWSRRKIDYLAGLFCYQYQCNKNCDNGMAQSIFFILFVYHLQNCVCMINISAFLQ